MLSKKMLFRDRTTAEIRNRLPQGSVVRAQSDMAAPRGQTTNQVRRSTSKKTVFCVFHVQQLVVRV
jgi:hypothetical protein